LIYNVRDSIYCTNKVLGYSIKRVNTTTSQYLENLNYTFVYFLIKRLSKSRGQLSNSITHKEKQVNLIVIETKIQKKYIYVNYGLMLVNKYFWLNFHNRPSSAGVA